MCPALRPRASPLAFLPQSREVARRAPGEIVGEFAIFSDEPRKASVVAIGRVKALLLTRDKYMELYAGCDAADSRLHVRSPPVFTLLSACALNVGLPPTTQQLVLEKLTTVPTAPPPKPNGV